MKIGAPGDPEGDHGMLVVAALAQGGVADLKTQRATWQGLGINAVAAELTHLSFLLAFAFFFTGFSTFLTTYSSLSPRSSRVSI